MRINILFDKEVIAWKESEVILHSDLNCFYAPAEISKHPQYGEPTRHAKHDVHLRKDFAMEEIRDIEGRLICYGDAFKGVIENAYKKQVMSIRLPVGGEVVIERENITTLIERRTETQFYVYSQHDFGDMRTGYGYIAR